MTPEDVENKLHSLPLDRAGPALRERVLSAIRGELNVGRVGDPTYGRRQWRSAVVVAALLLAAVAINLTSGALDRRLTTKFIGGPRWPQAARMFQEDVQSIAPHSSSWVPDYLQRFGNL